MSWKNAVIPGAFLAGVLAWALAPEQAPAPSGPAAPEAPEAAPAVVVGMADEILGINEAISVPASRAQAMGPELVRAQLEEDARSARALGARWVRGHTANTPHLYWERWEAGGRSWQAMDQWVSIAQGQDLKILAMIGPFVGNKTAQSVAAYSLSDAPAYAEFVRLTAERYDGDGVDDMPGLRAPILDWEVDNEPDLKNWSHEAKGAGGATDFCTPAQYAEVLRVSAAALRAANPAIRVHNGGFYRPMTDTGRGYIEALVAQPGVREAVDVVSVHAYFSEPDLGRLRRAIEVAREFFPGKPVRVTETSVPSAGEERWLSPEFQADMVVRVFGEALRQGVDAVFWHSLTDPPEKNRRKGPGMFSNSLMQAQEGGAPTRKPSGDALARLAEILRGVPKTALRPEGSGVWLGESAFLLPDGEATLPGGFGRVLRVWDGAPMSGAPDGESTRLNASDGALIAYR